MSIKYKNITFNLKAKNEVDKQASIKKYNNFERNLIHGIYLVIESERRHNPFSILYNHDEGFDKLCGMIFLSVRLGQMNANCNEVLDWFIEEVESFEIK